MKVLSLLFLVSLLLIPCSSPAAQLRIAYQTLAIPADVAKQRNKEFQADTISFAGTDFAIHAIKLEDHLLVYNAKNGQLLVDDPEGGLRYRDAPLPFRLSGDRLLLVTASKTVIVRLSDRKIQILDGRLYEIQDYNGDGKDDVCVYDIEGFRKNMEMDIYLSLSNGSLDLYAIGNVPFEGTKDGPLKLFSESSNKHYWEKYHHLQLNLETLDILPMRGGYNPTTLSKRYLDFRPKQGLPLFYPKPERISQVEKYRTSSVREALGNSDRSKALNIPSSLYKTLVATYSRCEYIYATEKIRTKNGRSVEKKKKLFFNARFCQPRGEVEPVTMLDNYQIITAKSSSCVPMETPGKEYWLGVPYQGSNRFLVRLQGSNDTPELIDLRNVSGIGYEQSLSILTGNYIYLLKAETVTVYKTVDIIHAREVPLGQPLTTIPKKKSPPKKSKNDSPAAVSPVVESGKDESSSPGKRVKLPPLKNQGKLISSNPKKEKKEQQKTAKKPDAAKVKKNPKNVVVEHQKKPEASKGPEKSKLVDRDKSVKLMKQGTQMARKGKLSEARALLEKSLLYDPANLSALNNLGIVLRKLNDLDTALKVYQSALLLDPGKALTHKNYAVLLEKIAIREYRNYLRLAPGAKDVERVNKRADWLENL